MTPTPQPRLFLDRVSVSEAGRALSWGHSLQPCFITPAPSCNSNPPRLGALTQGRGLGQGSPLPPVLIRAALDQFP